MLQKNGGEIRLGDVVIEGAATEDDGRLAYWVQFLVPADHAERQRFHIDNSNLFGEAHQKRASGDEVPFEPLKSRTVQGAAGGEAGRRRIEARLTAHSGRVGFASERSARGTSTTSKRGRS